MELFHLFSILIVLSALFAYVNFRLFKLPSSIGLMLVSLLFSLLVLSTGYFFPSLKDMISEKISRVDFSELLLEVMLSFMLFAGAIHIKYKDLKDQKWSILLLSTLSVLISTVLVGVLSYYLLNIFHVQVGFMNALLFGALISPTDPIAVLSILKSIGVEKSLETKIAGESLFNDGVAVVLFMTILQLTKSDANLSVKSVALLFGQEAFGGILLGLIIGWLGFKLIASIDNYHVEVLLTLAIVMGGYTAAHYLHVSGPLAMVIAGLVTGNKVRSFGMSDVTAKYIDNFWELIDEILNALLFVLIGLELLLIKTNTIVLYISFILVVLLLAVRYISVWIPSLLIRLKREVTQRTLLILTWGGLRGGISIALALSIPYAYQKEVWVTITYVIVCFSILIQGMTIGKVVKKLGSSQVLK